MLQEKKIKEHDRYWPQILDHLYRILITGDSKYGKQTNTLLNLLSKQSDIDKIYLYTKDPYETKSQLLIIKPESLHLKHCNYLKAFI